MKKKGFACMGERGSSRQWPQQGMIQYSFPSVHGGVMMSKDSGGYDLAELDHEALFLYLDGQDQPPVHEQRQTLNIFPSQPMHVEPSPKGTVVALGPKTSTSKRPSRQSKEAINPTNTSDHLLLPRKEAKATKDGSGKNTPSSSEREDPRTPDPKTLRRLAQNREAARKSRLRKKAYVQQLETCRIRLSQLEQELHRARSQGVPLGGRAALGDQGLPNGVHGALSSDASMFDMEYGRWLEEHHKMMCQLRAALEEQLPDGQLRLFVESAAAHYDILTSLKSSVAMSNVFHLVSGMWMTPAERCFNWFAGFRPSELIKIVTRYIEPLTEQQILGIYSLQQSLREAEDALIHGLEALHRSLSETITADALSCPPDMANFMGHMSLAINKLNALEGFVIQAENLRQQTIHRLHQILTTQQAARCFLAMAEYFHRLRALSSLWIARPRLEGV